MNANYIIDNAKVLPKGQITLPKDIRKALGVDTGSRVTLVFDGEKVVMMNAAIYAMKVFQKEMEGEAKKAGFTCEEDVIDYINQMRREEEVSKK